MQLDFFQKDRLFVSFSGGETSGMMSYMLKKQYSDKYDIRFVFANTGLENEETLEFVQECSDEFGLNVIWLEAVVDPRHGKGIRHKIICFNTADRHGGPYEAFIAKSGIPNANKPQCSDRLKALVIESYKRSIGWKKPLHAIGIRSDEEGRRSKNPKTYNLCYPLIDWPDMRSDKIDVNDFWENQSFRLQLEGHEGNCQTCWKKSDNKLYLLAIEHPERFDFMRRMEKTYQHVKPNGNGQSRVFFRRNRSVDDLFKAVKDMDAVVLRKLIDAKSDGDSGCSESCEAYA